MNIYRYKMNKILVTLLSLMLMNTAYAASGRESKAESKKAKAEKKDKKKSNDKSFVEAGRIYLYGVAMSPTDSIVYMTDELYLDSMVMDRKTKFLFGRERLSKQLATHMAGRGESNYVCSITFAKTVKNIDKLYARQAKILRKQGYLIKNVGQEEFRFERVRID